MTPLSHRRVVMYFTIRASFLACDWATTNEWTTCPAGSEPISDSTGFLLPGMIHFFICCFPLAALQVTNPTSSEHATLGQLRTQRRIFFISVGSVGTPHSDSALCTTRRNSMKLVQFMSKVAFPVFRCVYIFNGNSKGRKRWKQKCAKKFIIWDRSM